MKFQPRETRNQWSLTPLKTPDSPLATLNELARALSQTADLEGSLDAALVTVGNLLQLETGWVWLLDETGEPRLGAARNLPPGLESHPELMRGTCYCLQTYQAGDLRGAANVNVVWCSRLAQLVEGTNGLQCHASVPLYADDHRLGVLNVASRDWRQLSDHELQLLYTVGALLSLAIDRARLVARRAEVAALEERNRVAREIHDTLAQSLAAIVMQLETADARASSAGGAAAVEPIRQSLALARTTLEEARRSVLELREAPLEGRSLGVALRDLTRELTTDRVTIDVDAPDDGPVPPAVGIGLYRIAREAMLNAVRHAHADRITVSVHRHRDRVVVVIQDNGTGFDPAVVPAGRFGLVGMRERARLLGGTLSIDSAPDRGTVIEALVPLRA
jgi:two-component system, NarL family, sensor kinase